MLDPATVAEFRPQQKDPEVFTDRKELKAPLPMVAKGSVVEVEILSREFRPFSQVGMRSSFGFDNQFPVERARFQLEVPKGVGPRLKCEGFPEKLLKRTTRDGWTIHAVTMEHLMPLKRREPFQATDQELSPTLKYSTTPSWRRVAQEYAAILSQQTRDADLRSIAAEAVGDALVREEKLERVLAYVQKRVRYTGLEFGEASIVPRRPAEVLARGYGDCKDKACLLATLLEAAGIQARVALLRVGQEFDVDPDIPGLASFDHAIVFLPGPTPAWIDPTARLSRVGNLPVPDQDRYALVIDEATQGLVKTTQSTASQNRVKQTIEVFLAEDGPGRLVETLGASGAEELYFRDGYGRADAKRLGEFLKKLAVQRYQADDLGVHQISDADNLETPFQLRFEALRAGCAVTTPRDAAVFMSPWPLVDQFNNVMFSSASNRPNDSADDGSGAKAAQSNSLEEPRRTDLVLREPHVMEARWIIHPPSGYANDSLPENRTYDFGSSRLTTSFSKQADGTVEALYRFECSQLRWAPHEVMEARKALKAFGALKKPALYFQNLGEAHLSAGRIREALAEFQKSHLQNPKAAAPLLRVARAQLAGGLGESARASTRKALELEPDSAQAHGTQGWVLQHDLVGRRFKEGWNRKEALAAYRKAIALDPKTRAHRWNLAVLLEYDARGEHYESGKDLEESIRLYRALLSEEKVDSLEANLMRCLAVRGQFEEARTIAKAHLGSEPWNEWYAALSVCSRGLAEGRAEAAQAFQSLEQRNKAFLNAGELLVSLRRYEEGAALLAEGAAASEQQTQTRARAELFGNCRKSAPIPWPAKDPRSAVQHFLLRLLEVNPSEQPLDLHLARSQRGAWEPDLLNRFGRRLLNLPQWRGFSRQVVADMLLALSRLTVEGSEIAGYRVLVEMPNFRSIFPVVAEDGTYRVLSVMQDEASLARQALYRADQGDAKGAGLWLDQLHDIAYTGWSSDPLSPSPVLRLHTKGVSQPLPELKAAAASALAFENPKDSTLAILREAVIQAKDLPRIQAMRRASAYGTLARKELLEADRLTSQLQIGSPSSYTALQLRVLFFVQSGRWVEALELTQRVLKLAPEDTAFTKYRIRCLLNLHRLSEATAVLDAAILKGKLTAQDYADLTLYQIAQGAAGTHTLELARRATQNSEDQSSTTLLALAAALAELGRTSEARESLLNALSLSNRTTPRSEDWFVFGRIAEHLGDMPAARACYGRVTEDPASPLAAKNLLVPLAKARMAGLVQ